MPHLIYIPFLFALGASIGSFLNVVVYRLPLGISLVTPPSHCPHCETRLKWRDNLPVIGWILLAGKCRYCRKPIAVRYPIVEAVTGLLFVFYYVMFFIFHAGPTSNFSRVAPDSGIFVGDMTSLSDPTCWPIFGLYMVLLSGLLAASLIDAELFVIPASIPWWLATIGIIGHGCADHPAVPGALLQWPSSMALSAGSALGLLISIALLQLKIFPLSFPEGDLLESERQELNAQAQKAVESGSESPEIPPEFTGRQVRAEMRKEMLFLIPPMVLGLISLWMHIRVPVVRNMWHAAAHIDWLSGSLGAILGAMVGAFVIWLTRILGSYILGKEAMGLGDIHLMFGMGAILGGGATTVVFFVAPFAGILAGMYMLITRSRRQLPYGPYLSLAAGFVMLFYAPMAAYFQPGMQGLIIILRQAMGL